MIRTFLIVCALVQVASADKASSLAHYDKGKRAYAIQSFAVAAAEFEAAYAEWQTPEYLHDIGQAYRRLGRCSEAAAALERYLTARPDAANHRAVEQTVAELRASCPAPTPHAPATSPVPPAPSSAATAAPPATQPAAAPPAARPTIQPAPMVGASGPPAPLLGSTPAPSHIAATTVVARDAPHAWQLATAAGVHLLAAGPVVMPPVPELSAGVLRDLTRYSLHVGGNLVLARVPFDDVRSGALWWVGPEVSVNTTRIVHRNLEAFVGIAAGIDVVSGVTAGNPFTMNGAPHDAFLLVHGRGELGATWRFGSRIGLRIAPGYEVIPARSPFAADIPALHGFVFHAGVVMDL